MDTKITTTDINKILHDIYNTGFFSGLRLSGEGFELWEDENPMISLCLCYESEVKDILDNLYTFAYEHAVNGIFNLSVTEWVNHNPYLYNKLVQLVCS